jgi:hypothetical protein
MSAEAAEANLSDDGEFHDAVAPKVKINGREEGRGLETRRGRGTTITHSKMR